jgi:hypothetical protein
MDWATGYILSGEELLNCLNRDHLPWTVENVHTRFCDEIQSVFELASVPVCVIRFHEKIDRPGTERGQA